MPAKRGRTQAAGYDVAPNGCWLWRSVDAEGYPGKLTINGVTDRAHRAMYRLAKGDIPPELTLDHGCHNDADCAGGKTCLHRRCVNPDHLEPVARGENCRRGSRAKLTRAIVETMRRRSSQGASIAALAARYGVAESTAQQAITGRTWA